MGFVGHKAELISQDEAQFISNDWRDKRFDPREPTLTHRTRLKLRGSVFAGIWASMPKPDGKGAKG